MSRKFRSRGAFPAFPVYYDEERDGPIGYAGMTKREWMATTLAAGLMRDPSINSSHHMIAAEAVRAADALLAELEKQS